jgi:hypothetical protein
VTDPGGIDDLYALAPEGFVAARDALARTLKESGDPAAAAEVKRLRRPSVAAWALNQLVRREPELLDELIEAGEALRGAQRKAMSGVKESGFREATERRRRLVQDLTRRSADILAEAGRGAQAEDEIGRALEAASVDPQAAEELRAGRLEKPPSGTGGLEGVGGFEVFQGGETEPEALAEEADDERDVAEREAAEVAVRNAERQAEEAEAEARRGEIRAENLETQAQDVARRAEDARAEADRLAERAEEARAKLDQAHRELDALG